MPTTHHEIEITLHGKQVVPTKIPELAVGDTVRYNFSGGGKAIVMFPEQSPYRTDKKVNTRVKGGEKLTVTQAGKFRSGCRVELPNGTMIGWNPQDPAGTKDSGGDHDVKR
jgi:hypothetical protein